MVRVYAEAGTQDDADQLAYEIGRNADAKTLKSKRCDLLHLRFNVFSILFYVC